MKHPAIPQAPELQSGSAIPWSAEREFRLRRRITNIWFAMWTCLISGLGLFTIAFLSKSGLVVILAVLCLITGVFFLNALSVARGNLGEEMRRGPRGEFFEGSGMLANKPRSTQRLTQWIQHRVPDSVDFICSGGFGGFCGWHHEWKDAKWIPNYDPALFEDFDDSLPRPVDPGGGRFVILCPCGIGHFKLKLVTEQNIVDRAAAKDQQ